MYSKEVREQVSQELEFQQLLQDNENYLRKRCGLVTTGLSWNEICEIIYPKNPTVAKIKLLEHFSKELDIQNHRLVIDKLSQFSWFDLVSLSGIAKIINEKFVGNTEDFLNAMVDVAESMREFRYSVDEVFRLTYIYYLNKGMVM